MNLTPGYFSNESCECDRPWNTYDDYNHLACPLIMRATPCGPIEDLNPIRLIWNDLTHTLNYFDLNK